MKIHIVQKGDTIWEIAQKYGVNFEELKELNSHLSSPDMIMPGMKIKIPSTSKQVKPGSGVGKKEEKKKVQQQPVQQPPKMTQLPQVKEDDHKKPQKIEPTMPKQDFTHNQVQPQLSGGKLNVKSESVMPEIQKPMPAPTPVPVPEFQVQPAHYQPCCSCCCCCCAQPYQGPQFQPQPNWQPNMNQNFNNMISPGYNSNCGSKAYPDMNYPLSKNQMNYGYRFDHHN